MSSSETTQSSFQCLKSCLADKLSSNTNTTSIITSSVASNTNNNNSTASNPAGSNSNPSHIVVNNYPSRNNSHTSDNNCSESVQPTQFTFSSPQALTTRTSIPSAEDTTTESCSAVTIGPVTGTTDFLRDRALQVNGASSGLKISDNHLSTKLLRNNSSPYPSLRNQSNNTNNTLVHNANYPVKQELAAQIVSKDISVDQEMFENGPVNNNNIGTPNGGNHSNLMGSSGILSSSVGGGVNNIMMKHEPNGNNIELTIVDNQQHHHHLQQNGGDNTHHLQNHSGINLIIGGDSSACCSPAGGGGAVSDMDGTCSGASSTTSSCGIQVLDNFSHNHNHGLLGSSSLSNCGGMPSGNANGGGSLTSPGGSLDEHDCDDDKVINGDTFTTGDVPEPDAIKMFVGQIPKLLNEAELRALFEEFGRVFQINVLRDKVTKQSKGCCFVTYYTRKAALEAQNALHNVKTLSGMSHPLQMKPADNENRYERKLFVGMISKKCNEVDIRNMFSRYGIIDECTVLRDGTGGSKGCAFITFATKQCAQNAIKAVHQSISMEGCTSPIVVKFADTQKDKDQKRHQQLQASIINNISATTVNPIPQQYISEILKLRQILTQLQQQQQQQQQQQNNYFSQLSPLGVQGIAGLGALTSHGSSALAGLNSPHTSSASSDLATLAAIASLTNVATNQHSLAVGVQNLATLAALGNHSTLSPSGANGSTMGSTNTLANFTGNGLHAGLSSYTGSIRNSVVNKQVNVEGPEGANLFIYHLPAEFSDADLATMFTSFGNVISAKVFIDKQTNLSKCFGFVSFDNVLAAQLAIQAMNGFQIGMKRLKVQLKKSKDSGKPY